MLDGTLFVVKCARCGIPDCAIRNSFFMIHLSIKRSLYEIAKTFLSELPWHFFCRVT